MTQAVMQPAPLATVSVPPDQYEAFQRWQASTAEPPFWQSKKLLACVAGIAAIIVLVVIAVIWAVDKTIVIGAFSSVTTLVSTQLLGQTSVDRAQAYSPYSPDRFGNYAPGVSVPRPPPDPDRQG